MRTFLACLLALAYGLYSFGAGPNLIFKNQYGEQTNATTISPTSFIGGTIGAGTVISNIGTLSAAPVANTYAALSAKLVPSMLLTGWTTGTAGTVVATDTVKQGMQKINWNLQGTLAISNVLTGFASVSPGTIGASDTVLGSFQKLAANVAAHQANSTAGTLSDLVTDFNLLLSKLQAAKLMAP